MPSGAGGLPMGWFAKSQGLTLPSATPRYQEREPVDERDVQDIEEERHPAEDGDPACDRSRAPGRAAG